MQRGGRWPSAGQLMFTVCGGGTSFPASGDEGAPYQWEALSKFMEECHEHMPCSDTLQINLLL